MLRSTMRLLLILLTGLTLILVISCSSSEDTPIKASKTSDMEESSKIQDMSESEEEETITEADAIDIAAGIDQAVSNMDVEGLGEYLSPSAKITITVRGQTESFKADKYLEYLEKGWAKVSDYEYERLDEEITVGAGGRSAVIEADVTESMVMDGKNITITWREKVILGLVDGEVLVTKASSVAK